MENQSEQLNQGPGARTESLVSCHLAQGCYCALPLRIMTVRREMASRGRGRGSGDSGDGHDRTHNSWSWVHG